MVIGNVNSACYCIASAVANKTLMEISRSRMQMASHHHNSIDWTKSGTVIGKTNLAQTHSCDEHHTIKSIARAISSPGHGNPVAVNGSSNNRRPTQHKFFRNSID
jgi:hypothetical protein